MALLDGMQPRFSFLSELEARVALYLAANTEFKAGIEEQFGRIISENINVRSAESVCNQWPPSSVFDEAAMINLLDSACA